MLENSPATVGDMGSIPGQEDPLEKRTAYPLRYSSLENPTDREAWQVIVHGVAKESDTTQRLNNKKTNKLIQGPRGE